MKKIFAIVIAALAGVGIGVPIGWNLRKKTSEVQFVETTEEEQVASMIANGDSDMIPVDKNDIPRPANIQAAIDRAFDASGSFTPAEIPKDLTESVQKDIQNEMNREAGIKQMDTQKVQYFKQWKEDAKAAAAKYDTTTKELPDDITTLPDEAQKFVDEISEDDAGEDDMATGRPKIEPASEQDWERWSGKEDGAYDCVEIYWFDEDDVLSDEDGDEIKNPDKFIGFDVRAQFDKEKDGSNPDIRYVFNHGQDVIFKLIRRHTSFSRKRGMEEFGSEYPDDEDDSEDYLRSRV